MHCVTKAFATAPSGHLARPQRVPHAGGVPRASGGPGPQGTALVAGGGVVGLGERVADCRELKLMMQGLRGSGLNDSDRQIEGLEMRLVDVPTDQESGLPLSYDPEILRDYFDRLPGIQLQRIVQIVSTGAPLIGTEIWNRLTGNTGTDAQVAQAAKFNEIALSIRPDLLSPRAMVELQKLCDKVPSYSTEIAMQTLEDELSDKFGKRVRKEDVFSEITSQPVAAASLGQVYRAVLREPAGAVVAVKVQRPAVLETPISGRALGVSPCYWPVLGHASLAICRRYSWLNHNSPEGQRGDFIRVVKDIIGSKSQLQARFTGWLQEVGLRDSRRTDFVSLLDEFAARIYEELDYNQAKTSFVFECANGLLGEQHMAHLERVKIPKNFEQYCCRKVHVAEWVEGEKLSQSQAGDVRELVNVGVVAYLTQLLDKGLFHADPHPGNMLRTPDGRLAILDFGLMTNITDDQRYGMVEAISHLVHRDYAEIGGDFQKLDFIPDGVDVKPIVPALSRVFDAALAGRCRRRSISVASLGLGWFEFPFRIPPYFALIIRAIGVLEGIALVGDPDFAIIDEAYPYLSKQLLTNPSDRLRSSLRYMVYGKEGVFDADRLIDLLRALEAFRLTEKAPDAEELARKAARNQGSGLVQDMQRTETKVRQAQMSTDRVGDRPTSWALATQNTEGAREALTFLLSPDGALPGQKMKDGCMGNDIRVPPLGTVKGIDCLGRGGVQALGKRLARASPLRQCVTRMCLEIVRV
ncbi:Uncharacterized protein sll0005 [Durusdinium trenchii]|uniref:Uncharacterized protein sll0005 n=1 Tax=Durusdinium trenchii TaxID=1381693 RepID=A0ABP0MSM1_9DINO